MRRFNDAVRQKRGALSLLSKYLRHNFKEVLLNHYSTTTRIKFGRTLRYQSDFEVSVFCSTRNVIFNNKLNMFTGE